VFLYLYQINQLDNVQWLGSFQFSNVFQSCRILLALPDLKNFGSQLQISVGYPHFGDYRSHTGSFSLKYGGKGYYFSDHV